MSTWLSTAIAGVALLVSVITAALSFLHNRSQSRSAAMTAYFHWNRLKSKVHLPDGQITVGYNLVLLNQGPATARHVTLEVRRPGGETVRIISVEDGEFPLARIDNGGAYPIQFAPDMVEFLKRDEHPPVRRFDVLLTWSDGNGRHEKLLPLRRCQTDR